MSLTESLEGQATLIRNADNLLIDLDGTLIDSMDCLRSTYFSFLDSFGKTGSTDEFNSLIGPPLVTVVNTLKATYELDQDLHALVKIYGELLGKNYDCCQPLAGAGELLTAAGEAGKRLALVTGAHTDIAHRLLMRLAWCDYFNVVITGDSCEKHKPAPAPYLAAMTALSAFPEQCLVIEDSESGITSAYSAGMKAIGLCQVSDQNTLISAGANCCFESLDPIIAVLKGTSES